MEDNRSINWTPSLPVNQKNSTMGTEKPPRHVAVALVYSKGTHKLLMVSSRAHPGMWIREPHIVNKKNADVNLPVFLFHTSYVSHLLFIQ
jgi:hypothetical protein